MLTRAFLREDRRVFPLLGDVRTVSFVAVCEMVCGGGMVPSGGGGGWEMLDLLRSGLMGLLYQRVVCCADNSSVMVLNNHRSRAASGHGAPYLP